MKNCSAEGLVKRIAIPIASFTGSVGANDGDIVLWMTNPSVLLTAMVSVVLQRTPGGAVALAAGAVWQIFGAVPPSPGDLTEPQLLAAAFGSPRALPDGFVVDDPTKLLQIVVHLESEDDDEQGTVWAIATWEPKDACLSSAVRTELFSKCELTSDGGTNRTLRAGAGI